MSASKRTIKSDLTRIDAMRDKDIDYSDIPDRGDDDAFWARATTEWPPKKEAVSIRLDEDVIQWFKAGGRGYQTRINNVLRTYVKHQDARGSAIPTKPAPRRHAAAARMRKTSSR